jgi:5-methylcytosine-specific restriction endonuclease McrA
MADFRIPRKYMTPFGSEIDDAEALSKLQWLQDRLPMSKKQIIKRAIQKYYDHHMTRSFPETLAQAKTTMLQDQRQECYYCHSLLLLKDATIDHKKPLARGGTHSLENLCASCHSCNNLKSHMTEEEYRELMFRTGQTLNAIHQDATNKRPL